MTDRSDGDGGPLTQGPVPSWCERRVVVVPPGAGLPFDEDEWADALVLVARGAIELEGRGGLRRRLGRGAVLWLAGIPLRALHSCGPEPAVLVALSRRSRRDR